MSDYQDRLDAAQKAYDRASGAVAALEEQRSAEVGRLLEAHGVTDFESLREVRDAMRQGMKEQEEELDAAYKAAGI